MPGVRVIVSDAGDPRAVRALVDDVHRAYGRIDILFINAGIADMAAWGWVGRASTALLNDAPLEPYPNVKRWFEAIDGRAAAGRVRALSNKIAFKTAFDDESMRALFPQNFPKEA